MTDPADPTIESRLDAARSLLARIAQAHAPAVFASSFGAEDMVLLDLIARADLPIRVFTLDTGRLPQETHDLIDRSREHYGIGIDIYVPQTDAVQAFVREHGMNAFYTASICASNAAASARASRCAGRSRARGPGSPGCAVRRA